MPKLPETMKALVAYSPEKYVLETAWPRPKAATVCAGGQTQAPVAAAGWRFQKNRRADASSRMPARNKTPGRIRRIGVSLS